MSFEFLNWMIKSANNSSVIIKKIDKFTSGKLFALFFYNLI